MLWRSKRNQDRSGPPAGAVLLYHRIAAGQIDPYELCVTPQHFDQQMAVLRERFGPIALDAFVNHHRQGQLPAGSVAVTFDDGYIDNFETAGPILDRHGIDATVFMITGQAGRERELWWDELEQIFLQAGSLPGRLEIDIGGRLHTWALGQSAEYSAETAAQYAGWRIPWAGVPADRAETPTQRHQVFRALYLLMQPMTTAEQFEVLDKLRAWSGRGSTVRESHRAIALDALAETSKGSKISIGAHTIDHPALSTLPADEQLRQLHGSRETLETHLDTRVHTASYPFGLYNRQTLRAVRRAGFDAAFICSDKPVAGSASRFEIPRIQAPDVPGDAFEKMLDLAIGDSHKVGR